MISYFLLPNAAVDFPEKNLRGMLFQAANGWLARFRTSSKATSPRGRRANEDGSGAVLGTSVMVTVVVKKPSNVEDVNVPGPVKLGLI